MNPREGQHFRPSRGGAASWCGVFFLQRKTIMTTVGMERSANVTSRLTCHGALDVETIVQLGRRGVDLRQ